MPIKLGDLVLYSVEELSKELNVTRLTIRNYCREGRLRARKVGTRWYVSQESLRAYFNEPGKGAQGASKDGSIWD